MRKADLLLTVNPSSLHYTLLTCNRLLAHKSHGSTSFRCHVLSSATAKKPQLPRTTDAKGSLSQDARTTSTNQVILILSTKTHSTKIPPSQQTSPQINEHPPVTSERMTHLTVVLCDVFWSRHQTWMPRRWQLKATKSILDLEIGLIQYIIPRSLKESSYTN